MKADMKHKIEAQEKQQQTIIRPTIRRYFILFMFVVLAAIKSYQWVYLATITNVIAKFYNVSNMAVNWTTMMFMITYLVLALPTCWIMDRIGLRNSVLIGSFGLTLGVVIKCFSCQPDRFALSLIGHLIIGLVEPFFYSSCSQVALIWFPDYQVSLATAVGFMGDSMGLAIGFVLPGLMVGNDLDNTETIQRGLLLMSLGIALVSGLNTLLIVVFFDDQPKYPPGIARHKQIEEQRKKKELDAIAKRGSWEEFVEFYKQIADYFRNKNFNMIQLGFGISLGTGDALHTILNQIIAGDPSRLHYPDPNLVVGTTGLLMIVIGLFGSIACGSFLDAFHTYKGTTIFFYLATQVSLVCFAYFLDFNSPTILYLIAASLGFFWIGYCCSCIEFAVEAVYPMSELISLTLMQISAQVFGIVITIAGSFVVDNFGSTTGSWFLCLVMSIGFVATCATRSDYRRQSAIEKGCSQQQQQQPHAISCPGLPPIETLTAKE